MKFATTTFLVATFCCASAFGLNGINAKTSSLLQRSGAATVGKPMVRPIDIQGNTLSTPMSSAMGVRAFFAVCVFCRRSLSVSRGSRRFLRPYLR